MVLDPEPSDESLGYFRMSLRDGQPLNRYVCRKLGARLWDAAPRVSCRAICDGRATSTIVRVAWASTLARADDDGDHHGQAYLPVPPSRSGTRQNFGDVYFRSLIWSVKCDLHGIFRSEATLASFTGSKRRAVESLPTENISGEGGFRGNRRLKFVMMKPAPPEQNERGQQ